MKLTCVSVENNGTALLGQKPARREYGGKDVLCRLAIQTAEDVVEENEIRLGIDGTREGLGMSAQYFISPM